MKQFSAILMTILTLAMPAAGALTARVTPGYQYGENERPTVSTLNLLATPTISIFGTVDGTTGLTPGSVSGLMLMDTVADAVTLDWTTFSGGRSLEVQAAALVDGLGGIAVTNNMFKLLVDTNFFLLATNSIANTNSTTGSTLTNWLSLRAGAITATNLANGGVTLPKIGVTSSNSILVTTATGVLTNATYDTNEFKLVSMDTNTLKFTRNYFASANLSLLAGGGVITSNLAHGLAITNAPRFVRATMVCVTNDAGYEVGDEVDAGTVTKTESTVPVPAFTFGANSNAVWVVQRATVDKILNKISGSAANLTQSNWKIKVYASP